MQAPPRVPEMAAAVKVRDSIGAVPDAIIEPVTKRNATGFSHLG